MEYIITWHDSYKTGNKTIDQQHEKLFELANRVVDPANDPQRTYHNLLALQHYVKEHFEEEKRIMRKYKIQGFAEHAAEHENLLKQLDEIGAEIITNERGVDDILRRMQSWVLDHFFKRDMRLAEYFQNESGRE